MAGLEAKIEAMGNKSGPETTLCGESSAIPCSDGTREVQSENGMFSDSSSNMQPADTAAELVLTEGVDLLSHVSTWPYVRLCGLKTASANGTFGEVVDFVEEKGRYVVLLHGDLRAKLFRPANLTNYHFEERGQCNKCLGRVNLCAFPPCSCSPDSGQTSTTLTERSAQLPDK